MQNAPYVAGSGDPVNTETQPRTSFNGLVETFYGNVAMTTSPLPNFDFRLSYTIDDRDNQSSMNNYEVSTRSNTSTSANGDCTANGGLCTNLPFSYEHQTFKGEIGYRILPQTKLLLSETFETVDRNYADASFVTTNTLSAKIRSQLFDDVFGSLSYSHEDRNAHNYANNETWNLLGANSVASPTNIAEPSGLLMYFEASRRHDDLKGTIDFSPTHTLTTTLLLKFSNDFYPNDQYGLRSNHNIEIGPDISWQPTSTVTTHAYYTFQQIYYDQNSIYASAGTGTGPTGTGYSVPWTAKTTDSVHTIGLTMDWQAIPDVLKISFDYNFSYGDTGYALGDGMAVIGGGQTAAATIASLTFMPLPDVTSMLNMIQLRGEYTFRPNMTLLFGYAFERFSYKDFMNGTSATAYANALLPGTLNPNDSVQIVSAGMRIRF
jgi:MtrB/PioB family decaheme-associated outer membrane protein